MATTGSLGIASAALTCVLLVGACGESSVATLRGRWSGEIICHGGTSELSMTLDVFGEKVSGDAFTRNASSDQVWKASGAQVPTEKEIRCLDDTCATDPECVAKGGSSCSPQGQCLDCREKRTVQLVNMTLSDANVQIADPELQLERAGELRMEGTIGSFCPDEHLQTPVVVLTKQ